MSPLVLNTVMTICFVAGKSGGHLLPCVTQAEQIQQQNPHTQMYLFSSGSELDFKIMEKHQNIQHYVPTALDNPPYSKPWLMPWFACKTAWYFSKSLYQLWSLKPQKVVSFGGFVSIPTCLAAKTLGIPFEIYELNVEPGRSTKFLSYFTDTIHTCFATTKKYFPNKTCIMFDYPVRFKQQDLIVDRDKIFQKYQLHKNRTTVLILGGSQGSILLNETIRQLIESYPNIATSIQIIHQTGINDPFDYQAFYQNQKIPAYVFGYHERLQDFYIIADIIICRAGAGTLFEIKFFNKKCLTIPHETAQTNHQIKNVLELQKDNPDQFKIITQLNFNAQSLYQYLMQLGLPL